MLGRRKKSEIEYELIRSNRRTLGLQIKNGAVIVRAPYRASKGVIDRFVLEHEAWIYKHLAAEAKQREAQADIMPLSAKELDALADQAMVVIPERVRYYAPLVGVTYGRITIRNQRTRWGSCSAKGNLNFNCLLMLAPPEVIDAIVVHELCHRKHMDHSSAFYDEVLRVYPEYHQWNRWLKKHGREILGRMTG